MTEHGLSDPYELQPNEQWPGDVGPGGLGPDKPRSGGSGHGGAGLPAERWVRPSRRAQLALAAAMVLTGSVLTVMGLTSGGTPGRPAPLSAAPSGAASGTSGTAPGSPQMAPVAVDLTAGLPYAEPSSLTIPAIGIHAPVVDTGQAADGSPQVPSFAHPEQVGWYTSTASPGERGSSVLWGHLDTRTGTAVFANLSTLRVGDTVQVARADSRVATFTVERTAVYPRDQFPADAVYEDPGYPALRLVTCGGQFDRTTQEYASNVIVFARLASVTVPLAAVPSPSPSPSPSPVKHPKAKPTLALPPQPLPAPEPPKSVR